MIGENEANVGIASFSMFSISRLGSQILSSSVHAVFLLSSWTDAVAGTFSSYVISLPFFTHWVTYHCGVPTQGFCWSWFTEIFLAIFGSYMTRVDVSAFDKLCKQCHTLWTDHHVIDLGSRLIHDQDFYMWTCFLMRWGDCVQSELWLMHLSLFLETGRWFAFMI